jgi:hypothetical protein
MAGSVSMEGTGRISDFGNATEKEGAAGIAAPSFYGGSIHRIARELILPLHNLGNVVRMLREPE